VTFRKVDPFFVIEFDTHHLSPKILGEVKITGYSSYLHIYDETTIIGIGHETRENVWEQLVPSRIKFSVFNVTDPAKPKVAATDSLDD
jgi:inhibitor of cysteine peptidase